MNRFEEINQQAAQAARQPVKQSPPSEARVFPNGRVLCGAARWPDRAESRLCGGEGPWIRVAFPEAGGAVYALDAWQESDGVWHSGRTTSRRRRNRSQPGRPATAQPTREQVVRGVFGMFAGGEPHRSPFYFECPVCHCLNKIARKALYTVGGQATDA